MIVHLIVNSHLDPVWLWDREQGIDEVLNTARTACELLDDYPELHITRGEAWFYETIEKTTPDLFRRIATHISAGRWHIVGGWYVQPDCNLCSPETYLKHAEISQLYFRKKFGITAKTGYNVDSFGHSATLPAFYAKAGIENYVMMRPMKHEMTLPANDVVWKAPSGETVLLSRILSSYATSPDSLPAHIQSVLSEANPELGHVMCFIGAGDHGGGPVRRELDYLLEHRNDFPGVEFRFSHPDAYFEAVRKSGVELPVFSGELQHHAIGCYSVFSPIKKSVRRTENQLRQFAPYMKKRDLEESWKQVLFASFHDVLAGTCIQHGFEDVFDSLGMARKLAYDAFLLGSRKKILKMPPCSCQRLIVMNCGDRPYRGVVSVEPPLIPRWVRGNTKLGVFFDEKGRKCTTQFTASEKSSAGKEAYFLPLEIPSRGTRIFTIDYGDGERARGNVKVSGQEMSQGDFTVAFSRAGISRMSLGETSFLATPPEIHVIPDESDTWSHGLNSYGTTPADTFVFRKRWQTTVRGALVSEFANTAVDRNGNHVNWFCRMESGKRLLHLRLRVGWLGTGRLVKLVLKPSFPVLKRYDGIPGGILERKLNGEEYPVFNRIQLQGAEHSLTVVSPDITSLDVQPDGTLRLTLLRSPCFANHDPAKPDAFCRSGITGQGEQDFEILLIPDASEEDIENEIYVCERPVYFADCTYGQKR